MPQSATSDGRFHNDSPARVHSTTRPMFQNLPPVVAPPWRPSQLLGRCCPFDGASTLPAPASRRFPAVVPRSETTCCGRFRARPVRWIVDPSGESPGVVGTVACSISTRRGRGGPLDWNGLRGALVGRASRVRRCSVRGSQADSDSRMGCSLQGSPSLVPTAQHGYVIGKSPCTLVHAPHKHPDRPQSPHFHAAKWPKNGQNPKIASLRSMLREGADNWSARLCVASPVCARARPPPSHTPT